jgi:hypothetical protein
LQCAFTRAGDVVEYPAYLGGGEIGVDRQAGFGAYFFFQAALFQ